MFRARISIKNMTKCVNIACVQYQCVWWLLLAKTCHKMSLNVTKHTLTLSISEDLLHRMDSPNKYTGFWKKYGYILFQYGFASYGNYFYNKV